MTAYDEFPYRSRAYLESHIDRLFLVGHLFGMDVTPVDRCRVLEIGCADGGNLVPMAERLPGSTFFGIDLASRQIDDGKRWLEPVNLPNVELLHRNFKKVPQKLGNFDYIIAHGVYSWVPAEERGPLLAMIRERLNPNGVAYISYNTHPGWNTRKTIRDFLLQHTLDVEDAEERVTRVRTLLHFLHDASSPETHYGRMVRSQCEALIGSPPQYLFHGLLAEVNDPFYLKDFVGDAESHGLAYLGDAEFGTMLPDQLHPEGQKAMETVPGGLVDQEQVQDFLMNRSFRRSLLVHGEVELERSVPWQRCEQLFVSTRATLLAGEVDGHAEARFDAPQHVFVTDEPILKAGLSVLGSEWPANLVFGDWVQRTVDRCGRDGIEVRSMLGRNVLPLFARGVLALHPRDLGIAKTLDPFPLTTPWIRRRAELFPWVTDLRHGMSQVPAAPRFLLQHLDGTHDHRALRRFLDKEHRHGRVTLTTSVDEGLQAALRGLVDRSLLVPNPGPK